MGKRKIKGTKAEVGHGGADPKGVGPDIPNQNGTKKTSVSLRPADADKFDEHGHPKKPQ